MESKNSTFAHTRLTIGLLVNNLNEKQPMWLGAIDFGQVMLNQMMAERHLQPKIDFDGVATTESEYAHGVMRALTACGVRVPEDIPVVGFNDYLEDSAVTPSLTTMRKLFYEGGRRATEVLLALLAGQTVPERIDVPTRLMVRQSFGRQMVGGGAPSG